MCDREVEVEVKVIFFLIQCLHRVGGGLKGKEVDFKFSFSVHGIFTVVTIAVLRQESPKLLLIFVL
jgi:hypothetical protein